MQDAVLACNVAGNQPAQPVPLSALARALEHLDVVDRPLTTGCAVVNKRQRDADMLTRVFERRHLLEAGPTALSPAAHEC